MTPEDEVLHLLAQAKQLAKRYRELTGRPLGITGEIAEYEVARLLGLKLAPVRQLGYDVVREIGKTEQRLQVKGRCVLPGTGPGQRIGRIRTDCEWDGVILVLLDEDFAASSIYEADRDSVVAALAVPGSKARNERGALSVSKFTSIGRRIWPG